MKEGSSLFKSKAGARVKSASEPSRTGKTRRRADRGAARAFRTCQCIKPCVDGSIAPLHMRESGCLQMSGLMYQGGSLAKLWSSLSILWRARVLRREQKDVRRPSPLVSVERVISNGASYTQQLSAPTHHRSNLPNETMPGSRSQIPDPTPWSSSLALARQPPNPFTFLQQLHTRGRCVSSIPDSLKRVKPHSLAEQGRARELVVARRSHRGSSLITSTVR